MSALVDELIERLKDRQGNRAILCNEAADALTILQSRLEAVEAERDAAKTQIVAAWNAFAGHLADTAEEVYFQFDAADGDIAEQIKALTEQRDAAEAENGALKARVSELEGALTEAEETLRLAEHPAFPDPLYHDEVKRLGQRIGFGALMSTASAGWRETLAENKWPAGSEFVAGPCHGSVIHALKVVRATLSRTKKEPSDG